MERTRKKACIDETAIKFFRLFMAVMILFGGYQFEVKPGLSALEDQIVLKRTPFTRGVNLSGTMGGAGYPWGVQYTEYTKKDYEDIKRLGFDMVRLPLQLPQMSGGAPNYILDTLFLEFLDRHVNWSEELGLYLILENHAGVGTDENTLLKVWRQMAERYRNRSAYVMYEILNEPAINADAWGKIQENVINAIRKIDKTHTIVVAPANSWECWLELPTLPIYKDKNLIYTFHFYEPHLFTLQGLELPGIPFRNVSGFRFPASGRDSMPPLPDIFKETMWEKEYKDYLKKADPVYIERLFESAAKFAKKRNVPVFCGEFGAMITNHENEDRVRWYELVRRCLEKKNIPWAIWEYAREFGVFKTESGGSIDSDLNVPLIEALGLEAPEQRDKDKITETAGFDIYVDYAEHGILLWPPFSREVLDIYSMESPHSGKCSIRWKNDILYGSICFWFAREMDLSALAAQGYALEFMMRTRSKGWKLQAFFGMTGNTENIIRTTTKSDIPWRIGAELSESLVPGDGLWHKVRIPLSAMRETGAYKVATKTSYPPKGKFSWSRIADFYISASFHPLSGMEFNFDDIRIAK